MDYEYLVAEGVVLVREQRNTRDEDWSPAKSLFPAWAETAMEVEKVELINSESPIEGQVISFIERLAWHRDESGRASAGSYGTGSERYNRLQVGDRAIVVGVRPESKNTSDLLYAPEFWPHFSVTFNVLIRPDEGEGQVCVIAASEIDLPNVARDGAPWELVRQSEYGRELHCYTASPDSVFESVVRMLREGM